MATIFPCISTRLCHCQMVFSALRRQVASLVTGGNWKEAEDLIWAFFGNTTPPEQYVGYNRFPPGDTTLDTFFGFVRILEELFLEASFEGWPLGRSQAPDREYVELAGSIEFEQTHQLLQLAKVWGCEEFAEILVPRFKPFP
jgi:hypothetical protein